jgi:hypothetical protein
MIPITPTLVFAVSFNFDPWTLVWTGLMVVAVMVGVLVISLTNRWRKRADAVSLSSSDQLTQYRLLYEAGTLSKEEYERVRTLLTARLRSELQMPPTAPEAAQLPSDPPAREKPGADAPGSPDS